ncbi:MAG: glucosamine-6-phosphate deaminase [Planctomycetota bacterium]
MGIKTEWRIDGVIVEVYETSQEAAFAVADHFADQISKKSNAVLGLATGGTPIESYGRLIEMCEQGSVCFRGVTTFNLDEYIGLTGDHAQSYRSFMQTQLFDHIDVTPHRTRIPNGGADDIPAECAAYEAKIKDCGGIDLQLLGLGHNGHIAFNEPGSAKESRTRRVELTRDTIDKNSRFFSSKEEVPTEAITMGIATILECRRLLVLVTGEAKAEAVATMLCGPISTDCPASLLRGHLDVRVILDEGAASRLPAPS